MKDLVEFIVKSLVDRPEEAQVRQRESGDMAVIEIKAAQDDIGKVIGKEGRIAGAIRNVAKAAAAKQRKRVMVEIMTQGKEEVR